VSDAMSQPGEVFSPDTPIALAAKQSGPVIVADEKGLWGILDPKEVETIFLESGTLAELLPGAPEREFPHLHMDQSLAIALDRMGTSKLRVLPVVSRANVRQLIGIITLEAVLDAYGFSAPPSS
jgi:CBS domain-containing protein